MSAEMGEIIRIASEEFRKLLPENKATDAEIEEIEEQPESGRCVVTISYWARDNKPEPKGLLSMPLDMLGNREDLLNPWRKKYKRVVVDPSQGKAVAIRMYEPPLGVS